MIGKRHEAADNERVVGYKLQVVGQKREPRNLRLKACDSLLGCPLMPGGVAGSH